MRYFCKLSYLFLSVALLILSFSSVSSEQLDSHGFVIKSDRPHKVIPLHDGPLSLLKRLELIRNAKKSIELEYFIFNEDLAGKIVIDELVMAKKRGVRVRLLLDTFMVKAQMTPFHVHEIQKTGLEIRYYNDLPLIRAIDTQYRDHRKLFIVDDEHLIIGGRNIADEYFDLDERYNFLDREVYIYGEIVKRVKKTFDDFWMAKQSKKPERPPRPTLDSIIYLSSSGSSRSRMLRKYRSDVRSWRRKVRNAKKFMQSNSLGKKVISRLYKIKSEELKLAKRNEYLCHYPKFVSDLPLIGPKFDKDRLLRHEIYDRLQQAKKRITIDSPYFILTHGSDEIMKDILAKEVRIELLTNGIYSTDALPVASVFNYYLDDWLESGLKPYVFGGKRKAETSYLLDRVKGTRWGTHSKSIVFDDDSVMVGTFNFDPRSAFYSAEISLFCDSSPEITENVRKRTNMQETSSISSPYICYYRREGCTILWGKPAEFINRR